MSDEVMKVVGEFRTSLDRSSGTRASGILYRLWFLSNFMSVENFLLMVNFKTQTDKQADRQTDRDRGKDGVDGLIDKRQSSRSFVIPSTLVSV